MGKDTAKNALIWVVIIILVGGVASYMFGFKPQNTLASNEKPANNNNGECAISPAVVFGNALNKYTNVAIANLADGYTLNGVYQGLVTEGTSKTFTVGDKIVVYTGLGNNTVIREKTPEYTVGCNPSVTLSAVPETAGAYAIAVNGTPTVTVYNDKNQPNSGGANGAANNSVAMVVGSTPFSLTLAQAFQTEFGNDANGFAIVCQYNKTSVTNLVLNGGTLIGTPRQFNVNTGFTPVAYQFPALKGDGTPAAVRQIIGAVYGDPTNYNALSKVSCTAYDGAYFIDPITGQLGSGYETSQAADVGVGQWTLTIPLN